MTFTVGSLFTGIGGFDLGFLQAGADVRWQVENDKLCRKVLRRFWPEVDLHGDVRTVKGGSLERVTAIVGGFPCQDVSVAGGRAGLAGTRSGLWRQFHRLIAECAPRWVCIENVPGLLTSKGGRDMGTIVAGLAELGYGWAYRVFDAEYFGLAQRRERVFIVGCAGDPARAAAVLFEPDSMPGHPPARREAGQEIARSLTSSTGGASAKEQQHTFVPVAATLGSNAKGGARSTDLDFGTYIPQVVPQAMNAKWAKGTSGPAGDEHANLVAHTLRAEGADASEDGSGRGTPLVAQALTGHHQTYDSAGSKGTGPRNLIAFKPGNSAQARSLGESDDRAPALAGGGGGNTTAVAYRKVQKARHKGDGEKWEVDDRSATLSGHSPSRDVSVTTDLAVRRLTPTECERLQGFPDGWTEGLSDSARYRTLGNAVPVPVIAWIARRMLAVDA